MIRFTNKYYFHPSFFFKLLNTLVVFFAESEPNKKRNKKKVERQLISCEISVRTPYYPLLH